MLVLVAELLLCVHMKTSPPNFKEFIWCFWTTESLEFYRGRKKVERFTVVALLDQVHG